jgi:protein O-GlcNAc transferase
MNQTLAQNALALRRAGKLDEAAEIYQQILQRDPKNFEALHALGIVRYQRGQLEEAERLIKEAVAIRPSAAEANYNRACLLQKLNRAEEALSSFERAVALKPDYVEALLNRGTLLALMDRHEEALASFDKVVALRPNIAEAWLNRAGSLFRLARWDDVIGSADHALMLNPAHGEAWKIRGRALIALQRFADAFAPLEKASVFAPNDAEAWQLRGAVLLQLRRLAEALPCFDKALALAPRNFAARIDRANLLFEMERFEESASDYRVLLEGDPNCPSYIRGYLTQSRLHTCDWSTLTEELPKIASDVRKGLFAIDPLGNAVLSASAEEQLLCARTWTIQKFPPLGPSRWLGPRHRHERIRVAYMSADFRDHAVAFLAAGVFEHHDRARFESTALSFGADDKSLMRARLKSAFDRFIDIRGTSDADVADMVRRFQIDIAVDLTGHTGVARTGILARRPAPVQVNYLGYPATMGADYIDYVIGDRIVIPP